MKNFKKYKRFVYAIFCGILIGLILKFTGTHVELKDWIMIWFGVFIIILLLILIKSMNSMKLVYKGEYSKAIQSFQRIIEKYERNKKMVNAMIYNISLCLYRKGELYEAEDYLDKIDLTNCDDNVKAGYFNLRASNLILQEKNIDLAEEYFEKATQLFNPEEGYPVRAYFETLKGNQKEALRYVKGYTSKEKKRKFLFGFTKSTLVFDKFIYDIENNYFLGMAYLELNQPQLAKEYLTKASKGQYRNHFSERAEEILGKLENKHE